MTLRNDIFISYSSRDVEVANRIVAVLESEGLSCWIAHRDIVSGTDYPTAIAEAIEGSSMVVLVFSQSANDSADVNREIQLANEQRLPVFPVRIDKTNATGSMRYKLGGTHWYDIDENVKGAALQGLPEKAFAVLNRRPADREATPTAPGTGVHQKRRVNPALVGALGIGAVVALLVGATAAASGGGDEVLAGTSLSWDDLRVGDCVEDYDFTGAPVVVPCTQPHLEEVVLHDARFYADATSMPTEDEFRELGDSACYDALAEYTGLPYADSPYDYEPVNPSADTWADGDRALICVGTTLDGNNQYEIETDYSMAGNSR